MRGSWYRWSKKSTTNDYVSLDMRSFAKSVDLHRWRKSIWQWTWTGGRESSIVYIVEPERRGVRLQYTANSEHHDYLVRFVTTQPNYGGRRYWWLCPSCGRRVRILYGGRIFACRQCYNLTYETTQSGDLMTTIDNRIYRIRRKLGGSGGGIFDPLPERPKGMHVDTYFRLMREYMNLHQMRDLAFTSAMVRLVGAIPVDGRMTIAPADIAQDVQEEWKQYKADPAKIPDDWKAFPRRWQDEPEPPSPSRLTLGELATLAGMPFDFAKEAVAQNLLRPDQGRTTRHKRYRERLKNWLVKLWTLRNTGMGWEEIRAWTKRRFKPEYKHEKVWPVGYPKGTE